ncbi:MAG: hypothetical protein QM723_30085 [Myxococcaceae bacterium]
MISLSVMALLLAGPAAKDPSWEELVKLSMKELHDKESALPPADPNGSFHASQDDGTFVMTNAKGAQTVHARFQATGTYSTRSGSWLWAWGNPSIDEVRRVELEKVRAYGREHHFAKLTSDRVACTEQEAFELFAVAVHLIGAPGWYRSQINETVTIYLALLDLKVSR